MVCRVCLKNYQFELQMFDQNGIKLCIPDILRQHLWFTPSRNDPISTVICLICWRKLLEFHKFFETAKEAHKFYAEQCEKGKVKHSVELPVNYGEPKTQEKTKSGIVDPLYVPDISESVKSEEPDSYNFINTLESKETVRYIVNVSKDNDSDNKFDDLFELEDSVLNSSNQNNEETKVCVNPFDETEILESMVVKTEELETNVCETEQIHFNEELDSGNIPSNEQEIEQTTAINSKPLRKIKRKTDNLKLAKTTLKPKLERRSWSNPKDNEMVRKHINLICEICNYEAEQFEAIVQHFKSIHKNQKPYIICCGSHFKKNELVVQHAWLHEDPNHFQCEFCQRTFRNNYIKTDHIKIHHPAEEELVHNCDQCEKRFSRAYRLELHKAVHVPMGERKFFCNQCSTPKAFASQNRLNIHKSKTHECTPNICDVCGKKIRDRKAFEKHVQSHHGKTGPRVKCPHKDCDTWLKDDDNLKHHLRRKHTDCQIMECIQCKKLCKNRHALTRHMRIVHPTKLFDCEVCQKSFKRAISLKEHMAQHTGEYLYECPICNHKFNSNANMHAHKKKMHPVEWEIGKKLKQNNSNNKNVS